MLVVLRYEVPVDELRPFVSDARSAVAVLAECPGFIRARIGRATDDASMVMVSLEWEDVGSYRRALSSYDVKVKSVPLLSRAVNEPSAFEILHSNGPEGVTDKPSSLAPDADMVSIGEASGPIPS